MEKREIKVNYEEYDISWIMDIPFSTLNLEKTTEYLVNRVEDHKPTHVVTANPEIVMYADKSPEYKQVLLEADMIVPDGIGVVYASRLRKKPVEERVAGYDLLHKLLAQANENEWSVYILGSNEEVNKLSFERLANEYSKVHFVGRHHGYFADGSIEEKEIIEEIKQLKPQLIFVALGFPRQELWIRKTIEAFGTPLMMGVGGSLDVVSGKVKRAPLFWQRLGLEWFHRLITNPSRWRRMLVLPQFMIKEILLKIKK